MKITILLTLIAALSLNTAFAQGSVRNSAPEATVVEAALSFRDIPYLQEAFIDTAPTDRKDGIPVGELGIDVGNKAMILKLAQEIADSKHGNFDSYLIAHRGKLIFESYYRRGRINLPHAQASATKAYTSLALGRAIQLGYLSMTDLDKPLINFLKELELTKLVKGTERITLHQALTMRSGIRLSQEQREQLEKKPTKIKGQAQVQAFLAHSAPITSESQSFKYQFDPMLVMQVIEAVVPGSAKDFIKNELLEKMGITNYGWETDVSGLPKSGSRSSMTSRDMLKWGTLAINKGKWNGEQLVPEAFIGRATSKIVDQSDEYDDSANGVSGTAYGYFWWQADLSISGKSYLSKAARGGSGQNIIVIEALDLVIVTTTHRPVDDVTSVTATRVLPAFIENSIPTMSGKSDSQDKIPVLEGPYLGQKSPGLTPEVFALGILSRKHRDGGISFTPDMKEFYFSRKNLATGKWWLVGFRSENNRWTESVVGPRVGRPTLSPDGNVMHLGNKYMERTEAGWSDIKSLGPMFEREDWGIMRLSSSAKGTYVFDDYKSNDVLRISRIKDGKREAPELLGKEINAGKWTAHPFIAPDESYIIWDSEKDSGYGDKDLYISFQQQDGSWGAAINMGKKINTSGGDSSGFVTPDGKYFFFDRWTGTEGNRKVAVYWVDAQVIENLRPKK
ncbi:serine hydrolase domain-containing protein [Ekhidna sp.]